MDIMPVSEPENLERAPLVLHIAIIGFGFFLLCSGLQVTINFYFTTVKLIYIYSTFVPIYFPT